MKWPCGEAMWVWCGRGYSKWTSAAATIILRTLLREQVTEILLNIRVSSCTEINADQSYVQYKETLCESEVLGK